VGHFENRASGAEARFYFGAFAARLKSCPFTTISICGTAEVVPFTTISICGTAEVVPFHDVFKLTQYPEKGTDADHGKGC
jgi:hypothetical protein